MQNDQPVLNEILPELGTFDEQKSSEQIKAMKICVFVFLNAFMATELCIILSFISKKSSDELSWKYENTQCCQCFMTS